MGLDNALDAAPKHADVEGDEEAQAKASGSQVREDLRDMSGCDALHRIELDDQAVVREQVEPDFASKKPGPRKRRTSIEALMTR